MIPYPCFFWFLYGAIGAFCIGFICALQFIEWGTRKGYTVYEKRGKP